VKSTTWAAALLATVAATTVVGCGETTAHPSARADIAQAQSAAPAQVKDAGAAATTPAAPTAAPTQVAPAPKAAAPIPTAQRLSVKRLVVARGVSGREPVGAKDSFYVEETDRLYAFVEVENAERAPGELHVSFVPEKGGASRGNITLPVGAEKRWRTWAFTRTAREPGKWVAVVKNDRGEVLARAPFEVVL
jgi:hypothetical protein